MAEIESWEMDAEVKARVPQETRNEVERIARSKMQSVSDVVRAAVLEYLAAHAAHATAPIKEVPHAP